MKRIALLLALISISCLGMPQTSTNYKPPFLAHNFSRISWKTDLSEKKRDKYVAKAQKSIKKYPGSYGYCSLYMGLAYSYFMANKSLRDIPKAMAYFDIAIDSIPETDSIVYGRALYNKALLYYKNGEMQNFDSAYRYFELATHYGDIYYGGLAEMYQYGLGVEMDPEYAYECYKQLTLAGIDNYAAMYSNIYYLDQIAEGKLDTAAYRQYREAILIMSLGEGNRMKNNPEDMERNKQLLLSAAQAGYAPAMCEYAGNYLYRYYEPPTKTTMANIDYWLKKAMEQGYVPAIYTYGYREEYFYDNGRGPATSNPFTEWAVPYYKKAAIAGFPPAQNAMGMCYLYGLGGVPQNYGAAKMWFQYAADQGWPASQKKLKDFDKLVNQMEKAKIQAALQELSASVGSLGQSLAAAIDKSQNKVSETQPEILNDATSTPSGKKETSSNTKENRKYKWADIGTMHKYQHIYDEYARQLSKMNYGWDSYNETRRLKIQREMANIRSKWEAQDYPFHKSDWETWNGNCDYYKE